MQRTSKLIDDGTRELCSENFHLNSSDLQFINPSPPQGSTCLEAGSYLLNYQGCTVCKALGLLQEVEREKSEDNNEETISFKREQAWTGGIPCQSASHTTATL